MYGKYTLCTIPDCNYGLKCAKAGSMTAFGINVLDIVFVIIVAVFAVRGLLHGLLEEAAALLGLFLGFVLADRYIDRVVSFLNDYVSNSNIILIAAYLAIFTVAMLAAFVVTAVLKKVLVVSVVKWLDCMAGAVFGAVKALVICLLIYMGFQFIAPDSELLQGSVVVPYLSELLSKITEILPNLSPDQGVSSWFEKFNI